MTKFALPLAVVLALITAPAFADHCPKDVQKIDAALSGDTLSAEDKAEVKALRDEGEDLHQEGKHSEALEALHDAMEIAGIKH